MRSAGYPYEKHAVVTEDGYVLTLERIARPGATRCVYLQHGVLDNSFAWIATGATSLAFRAYDDGKHRKETKKENSTSRNHDCFASIVIV